LILNQQSQIDNDMPPWNDAARLDRIAHDAMLKYGLQPEWPPEAIAELARLKARVPPVARDLRSLLWSSIDNDESRDLDQLEVAVDDSTTRLLIAIADVDALVHRGSALDSHAQTNTTSVYTPARVFPMLPPELSTDRTSLNEREDRAALVIEMTVDDDGIVTRADVYQARVQNRAKLTYNAVAAWLDDRRPAPRAIADSPELANQVKLQDRIASRLRRRREEQGALDFDRREVKPVVTDGTVTDLRTDEQNRARDLIESFMVAANGATAQFLATHGYPSIRRVVRSPERWPRIVDLARQNGASLPPQPDARALQQFLRDERAERPDDFSDLSLSVIKLLGRGEYVAESSTGPSDGHFALAVSNYTHSTAPNRRFTDLVTQRLLKAALAEVTSPYPLGELSVLAAHCTRQEDAANKVERLVRKAASALWMSNRIGDVFDGVITGASPKGTWARLRSPLVEGRVEKGEEGLDVGDRVRVRLLSTDPDQGFIDFARV
jgi:VacB/RNase II family 3'-5' exoribonuclease